MDIQREEFELTFQKTSFCKNMVKSLENSDCPFTSVFEMRNGKYRSSYVQLSFEIWQAAKAQAVPAGFVLVKKELPEQIAEKMAIDHIDKPRHENNPVWSEIAEQSYKDQVKSKKWEFWRDYKAMIEAQVKSLKEVS
ncbi:hypothetical protein [Acinetobacter sp. CFCC 11171]|uniref:hypothetical protein n=1 Tax=Acinetobacter sp. CFCC 11171 TaxID=1775558 RepID=UPI001BC882A9|nr:hypothetical protein [Acinetobacter sp. CFCC 11171]